MTESRVLRLGILEILKIVAKISTFALPLLIATSSSLFTVVWRKEGVISDYSTLHTIYYYLK